MSGSVNPFTSPASAHADGMTTPNAEALGDADGISLQEMAFSIDKTSVTASSRALKAEYSTELAQDLKAVHGLGCRNRIGKYSLNRNSA